MSGARQAALEAAARVTLARLRGDRETAPAKIRPLIAYLEEHVFDPGFSVAALAEACGVRDSSLGSLFKLAMGDAPREYLAECRLEVAARLLRDTDFAISEVAELVGYSDQNVFGRAFRRWCRLTPDARGG